MDVDCLHEWQHCLALSITLVSSHLMWSCGRGPSKPALYTGRSESQEYGKQVVFKSVWLLRLVLSKLKIPCQWRSSPRSCIGNPAAVAGLISRRPGGGSRPG